MAQVDLYGTGDLWRPDQDTPYEPLPVSQPAQTAAPSGGWSKTAQNDPYGGLGGQWAKQYYDDPTKNGGDEIQKQLAQYRSMWGSKAPADDASLIQMIGKAQAGMAPDQFDDPYTNQYENILKKQMGDIYNNPMLKQLQDFLQSQFGELSQTPGFSPAEMAMLNTQAFEPIEQRRTAAKREALNKASAHGYLPTSGIAGLSAGPGGSVEGLNVAYDRMRTQADRDLAINGIDRRDQDLQRAQQYAQMLGLTIPGQQRSEEQGLARMLQQLPSESLNDLLKVLGGSPTAGQVGNSAEGTAAQSEAERRRTEELWRNILIMIGGFGG